MNFIVLICNQSPQFIIFSSNINSYSMRIIVIVILGLVASTYALTPIANAKSCQSAVISFISDINAEQTLTSNIVQKIPNLLNQCGLSQLADKSTVSIQCSNDLSQGIEILQHMSTQQNKAKLTLDMTLLTALYNQKILKSCDFLNKVNIAAFSLKSNSSGVCLQAAYQLSLTVQNLWQHLVKSNFLAAFRDFQQILTDLPDTLDSCGDHALADKIRKDFPAACLTAFENLGKELIVVQHNFDHLEWMVKHWKDITKVVKQVKTSCPVFHIKL